MRALVRAKIETALVSCSISEAWHSGDGLKAIHGDAHLSSTAHKHHLDTRPTLNHHLADLSLRCRKCLLPYFFVYLGKSKCASQITFKTKKIIIVKVLIESNTKAPVSLVAHFPHTR